jgi:hypothetical protein
LLETINADTWYAWSYAVQINHLLMLHMAESLQAVVSSDEAEAMARRLNLKFYRACVKENLNVTEGESRIF